MKNGLRRFGIYLKIRDSFTIKFTDSRPMVRYIFIVLVVLSCPVVLFGGSLHNATTTYNKTQCRKKIKLDIKDKKLWNMTFRSYLLDSLWQTRDIYDAGHYLMVPMHAAFEFHETGWQEQLSNHFRRFVKSIDEMPEGSLARLQYSYLGSQFCKLSVKKKRLESISVELSSFLYKEIKKHWNEVPWGRKPYYGGLKEYVHWKLTNHKVKKSYYRAINDHELFVFAIAADLRYFSKIHSNSVFDQSILSEILRYAKWVFSQEIVFSDDGGWLLQPGVWTDHRDFAYAGHTEISFGMQKKPCPKVAPDSSHSHRFPLWLKSLQDAYLQNSNSEEYKLYRKLRTGLAKQFHDKVLLKPNDAFPSWRTTNFMDGWNGVYRWQYKTLEKNTGYGPYQLSGALLTGWWIFLQSGNEIDIYSGLADLFPLSERLLTFYGGTQTTRERHPLINGINRYHSGIIECIVRLAAKLAEKYYSNSVVCTQYQ